MRNRFRTDILASCCLAALLLAPTPAQSGEPEEPADKIGTETKAVDDRAETVPILDATTSATPRYKPVTWKKHFDHAKKLKGNCRRCHHDLRGSNTTAGKCAHCHTAPVDDMTLIEAWHGLCRDCHLDDQLKGQKHGPIKCLGCHEERD